MLFACDGPEETAELAAAGFVTTVIDLAGAKAISARVTAPTSTYVKVDVGFGRLGIPLAEASSVIRQIVDLPHIRVAGLYTHAPFKDRDGAHWAGGRLAAFDQLIETLADHGISVPITQARASGCLLAGLNDNCNAICVGHALFGLSPFDSADFDAPPLRPVLQTLETTLISVNEHGQGSDIAIAGRYRIDSMQRIGVLPVGRGHGMERPLPDEPAYVLVRGRRAPIIAVSLEHTTIDLDAIDAASVGDVVTVLGKDGGEHISLDDWARWVGQSPLQRVMAWSERAVVQPLE